MSEETKTGGRKAKGQEKREDKDYEIMKTKWECREVRVTEEKRELKVWQTGRRKRWRKIVGDVFGRSAKKRARRRVRVGKILTFLLLVESSPKVGEYVDLARVWRENRKGVSRFLSLGGLRKQRTARRCGGRGEWGSVWVSAWVPVTSQATTNRWKGKV